MKIPDKRYVLFCSELPVLVSDLLFDWLTDKALDPNNRITIVVSNLNKANAVFLELLRYCRENINPDFHYRSNKIDLTDRHIRFYKGSLIEVINCDNVLDAQCGKHDYTLLLGVENLGFDIFTAFAVRTRKQVFLTCTESEKTDIFLNRFADLEDYVTLKQQ